MQKRNAFRKTENTQNYIPIALLFLCAYKSCTDKVKALSRLNNTRRYFTEKTVIGNFKNLLKLAINKTKVDSTDLALRTKHFDIHLESNAENVRKYQFATVH